ncbi:MAG: glycoside hydrolase family 32 protein [Bacteroidota bacterium]
MTQKTALLILLIALSTGCREKEDTPTPSEVDLQTQSEDLFRPKYHFSPPTGWLNDPNGLVYHDGRYHLFYQHYPNATVWGPMHWGHAVSEDMVQWEHQPIALFPDEKGMIFSGSAVADTQNTSGFGVAGKVPLVAIFTYHAMQGEKSGRNDFQTQGIAYSLDNGITWKKYEGNPVLGNNGIRDLRDPKVFWHEGTQSWIMVLVAGDHAKLYRSNTLKDWDNISDFGEGQGAQGGVWECPDLFPLRVEGTDEKKWVLIISIGSGGPNGGSATQYFVGDFDGTTFTSDQMRYKWLDWGTDNYAGVTYNNTPNNERIFIGWMSNWQYALKTPTHPWRSAMTLPRKLTLHRINNEYVLYNYPLTTMTALSEDAESREEKIAVGENVIMAYPNLNSSQIAFKVPKQDFKLTFSNTKNEKTVVLLDAASHLLMLDRTASGTTDFHYEFGNKLHYAALENVSDDLEITIFLDTASIEVFLNKGQYVMTDQLFPSVPYTQLKIENLSNRELRIRDLQVRAIRSLSSD